MGKVFLDENGAIYFIKEVKTFKFITVNPNGESIYNKTAIKTEEKRITPEQLGYTKSAKWDIYVYKTEHEELEDKTVYYSMTLNFAIPEEKRYKTAYFKTTQSGRVFLTWFESGTCSEVSINDPEFCTRSKAKRLSEDTILQRGSPIFTLSAEGILERRLQENEIY
jgi:hypothetical protein